MHNSSKTCFLLKPAAVLLKSRKVQKSSQLEDHKLFKHLLLCSTEGSYFGLKIADIHIRIEDSGHPYQAAVGDEVVLYVKTTLPSQQAVGLITKSFN